MSEVKFSEMTVEKSFEFDAAHRLLNYEGACKNLHGHRWKVGVEVSKPSNYITDNGFLFDFHDFKFFGEWLKEKFDHATIINKKDIHLCAFAIANKQKQYVMEGNPTVENLSLVMLSRLRNSIFSVCRIKLTIWETPSSKLTLTSEAPTNV